VGIAQQSPLLEQVEQFKDDHDNDNYSDYIEAFTMKQAM
jgi:hypothetical protein